MTSLTKNPHSPTKKIFFVCRHEDLPRLSSLWTALYHFQCPSYTCAKPRAIRLFWCENPWNQPDPNVLRDIAKTQKSLNESSAIPSQGW